MPFFPSLGCNNVCATLNTPHTSSSLSTQLLFWAEAVYIYHWFGLRCFWCCSLCTTLVVLLYVHLLLLNLLIFILFFCLYFVLLLLRSFSYLFVSFCYRLILFFFVLMLGVCVFVWCTTVSGSLQLLPMQFNCKIILFLPNQREKNANTKFLFLNDLATNQIDPCSKSLEFKTGRCARSWIAFFSFSFWYTIFSLLITDHKAFSIN